MGGRMDDAERLLVTAIAILDREGMRAEAATAQSRLGDVLFATDRIEEGVSRLEAALDAHEAEGDESAIATVSAQLARLLFFEGHVEAAMSHVERALELGERLRLAPVVVEALINKALILRSRPNESLGLMRQALLLSEECGFDRGTLRACMNLSYLLGLAGPERYAEAQDVLERGLALARRRGDRVWEQSLLNNLISGHFIAGEWDDVERLFAELPQEGRIESNAVQAGTRLLLAELAHHRGETDRAIELAGEFTQWTAGDNLQSRSVGITARAVVARVEGRHADALAGCLDGLRDEINSEPNTVDFLLTVGTDCALAIGSPDGLAELLEAAAVAPIDPPPWLTARTVLHRTRLAVLRNEDEPPFGAAVASLRQVEEPFWIATAQLEQAEWLAAHGRADRSARRRGAGDLRTARRGACAPAHRTTPHSLRRTELAPVALKSAAQVPTLRVRSDAHSPHIAARPVGGIHSRRNHRALRQSRTGRRSGSNSAERSRRRASRAAVGGSCLFCRHDCVRGTCVACCVARMRDEAHRR